MIVTRVVAAEGAGANRVDEPQLALAPRHVSMLSCLLFDGPMTVNDLAARLGRRRLGILGDLCRFWWRRSWWR
jgi:hypothetical protein